MIRNPGILATLIHKPTIRFVVGLVLVISIVGCSKPVTSQQLEGRWTLVATGFEPMETVVPNDRFTGWVTFNADMTYEMEMEETGVHRPVHRSGTYSLEGDRLQTVTGAKVSSSKVFFHGPHLVTVTRQKTSKRDFYFYYLPTTEKPHAAEQPPSAESP